MDANTFSFIGMLLQSGNRAFNTVRAPQSSIHSLGKSVLQAQFLLTIVNNFCIVNQEITQNYWHYYRKKKKAFYPVLSNNLEPFLSQSNLVPLSWCCMCPCLCLNSMKSYSTGWHHVVSLLLHHTGLKIYERPGFFFLLTVHHCCFDVLLCFLRFSHFWIQIFEVHRRGAVICTSACDFGTIYKHQ